MSKRWLGLVALALGCAAPAFGGELLQTPTVMPQVYYPPAIQQPAIQQTAAYSRWDDPMAPVPQPAPQQPAVATNPCNGAVACGACDSCDPGCQIIAAVEGTFFWPQFNRNFLSTSLTNTLGTNTLVSNAANGSADGTLLAAPRITFGAQGERWGIVARYWYAQANSSAFVPAIPASPIYGVVGFDTFRAYTADLEVQRRFCWCNWDMYGFGGVRYASVNNDRSLWTGNSFGGPSVTGASTAWQQFNGTGITFGFMGFRPIWCDDSPWKVFFANRYSILWGNGLAAAPTSASIVDTGTFQSHDGALAGAGGDMFIAEVQLGLQWDCCLKCLPGRAFLRTAVEYQYWDGGYNTTANAFSFAASTAGDSVLSNAAVDALRFSLVGFTIGAGIMY